MAPAIETLGFGDSNGDVIPGTAQVLSILWDGRQLPSCRSVRPRVLQSACALGGPDTGFSGSYGMPDGVWGAVGSGRMSCMSHKFISSPRNRRHRVYSMRIGASGAPSNIQNWEYRV